MVCDAHTLSSRADPQLLILVPRNGNLGPFFPPSWVQVPRIKNMWGQYPVPLASVGACPPRYPRAGLVHVKEPSFPAKATSCHTASGVHSLSAHQGPSTASLSCHLTTAPDTARSLGAAPLQRLEHRGAVGSSVPPQL